MDLLGRGNKRCIVIIFILHLTNEIRPYNVFNLRDTLKASVFTVFKKYSMLTLKEISARNHFQICTLDVLV